MRLQVMVTKSVITLFAMALASKGYAQDVTLNIVDQYGQPLTNAVVEIASKSNKKLSQQLPVLIMDQVDKQFSPTLLIAHQGQQVNFPNSDNIRHHVYSFSEAKPFQLKLYSGQPENPITFENQGVVVLGCNIHDSMLGYIYVAKSADVYQSDERGNVQLSGLTLPVQLTLWHSLQKNTLEEKQSLTLAVNSPHSLQVTLQTTEPKPRNTFGSKFKGGND
ncbi:methylamine utilization protein [Pseudoalteromonas sp. SR44-5]|uniref:methylamine utilization protein n=1 Tax=Pseudoalteromonas TaxID=53246 RepID=UPI001602B8C1|nr:MULTISPECIES: methylamine utilization protein [unclassified Pseudoalteromonas]MBB1331824.1 methylamine utilization protein [Pseudoalteromonas sp. SR41-6]MBB1341684.1 methylamine utilization protein [Pseudoalteromonas sp. SR45-6]MBB1366945.1 methylamine utilization protein [Pseudoalteromonas sp. SR44-5]MBB1417862.1 methylamine utilization protein [Pseudoalteromonas sp. SG44-1]MBB1434870.1 methylamine utilization protein [Pseudoalteromonas sp. SG43-6]